MFRRTAFSLAFFLLPSLAWAHATVTPNKLPPGYGKVTFSISHGCQGSPTEKVTIKIPDGIVSVKPKMMPGWTVKPKVEKLKTPYTAHGKTVTEDVTEITYEGKLPDNMMEEFAISVKILDAKPGTKLVFPVVQTCTAGSNNWVDIAKEGAKPPEFPAPVLEILGSDPHAGHH